MIYKLLKFLLNNNFSILYGKANTNINYPDGFNKSNCMILGWQIKTVSGQWQTGNCIDGTSYENRWSVGLNDNGVILSTNESSHNGRDVVIVIYKLS